MRIVKFTVYVILAVSFTFFVSEFFRRKVGTFAGSYPFAKTWKIKAPISEVKEAVLDLKETDPNLFVEGDSLLFAKDHTGYWLKVNFYDEENNKVVHTLIREVDKGFTNLTLVSFIDKETGDVRFMNRDFGFLDNRRQIKRFDDLIVKRVLKNERMKPHSMPITAR